jgi:hypothetical protein
VPTFEPEACTPAAGWEKSQVENQVGLVRERFFTPRLRFKTLEDLNGWLADKCVTYAKVHRHPEQGDRTVWEIFEDERASFIPYAGRFDGFHCIPASVSKTCTVRFDNNKYSVLSSAVGRPVEIHAYAERIVIRQDGHGRTCPLLRPRRGHLRSLALRTGAGPQAGWIAQWRAVPRLDLAIRPGEGAPQAQGGR